MSCHGPKGYGDGPLSGFLQDVWGYPVKPRNLVGSELRGGSSAEDVFRVVTVGVEGTPMPSFGALLKDDERWALVAYVRKLRNGGPTR
jgi:mono/diheme cytochrome c family protein